MSSAPSPYLAMLPSEIWLACWTLCSSRQLRRLSLVCHLFRSLCLPLLFQTQCVDTMDLTGRYSIDTFHKLHRAAVRLERIADGPQVRMVRSWTFAGDSNLVARPRFSSHITNIGMVDAMYQRVVTAFSSTFGRYSHLRSLNIGELLIDRPFRDTLVFLPMLEEVTLRNCEIPARDGVLLNLKYFMMSSRLKDRSTESLELVSPGRLQTLKIDGQGDTIPLMRGFGGQRFSHLTELSLDTIFDLNLFLHFLTQCPRLQSLTAREFSRGRLTSFSSHVHPETIPLLRSIAAPLDLVRALTPNRPVRDVIVRSRYSLSAEDLRLAVLDISNVSVPLRSLTLPYTSPSLESLNNISSLFPGLSSLSMEIHCKKPTSFACSRAPRRGEPWTPELDTRIPDVCDPSPAVYVASETHPKMPDSVLLHKILSWMCSGLVSLPAEIEVLRLSVGSDFTGSTELSVGHQRQVVAALNRLYPSLRELQMGNHNNPHWERNGALWKRKDVNSYIQVHT
ncbi:hypothetical protein DFH09DRAFT_224323 [Mycena vulgaris]|nr:hypothetical protein DFH09DRAFT_224323 [Mycena vulgaris]